MSLCIHGLFFESSWTVPPATRKSMGSYPVVPLSPLCLASLTLASLSLSPLSSSRELKDLSSPTGVTSGIPTDFAGGEQMADTPLRCTSWAVSRFGPPQTSSLGMAWWEGSQNTSSSIHKSDKVLHLAFISSHPTPHAPEVSRNPDS